jgi:hypothetical protein
MPSLFDYDVKSLKVKLFLELIELRLINVTE